MTSTKPPKSRSSVAQPPTVAASYEAAVEELEQLLAQLDAGQLPLDQMLTRYQRGADLLGFCRGQLQAVEAQIKVFQDSELKPWDAA